MEMEVDILEGTSDFSGDHSMFMIIIRILRVASHPSTIRATTSSVHCTLGRSGFKQSDESSRWLGS
jgi:hypothetical protein